MNTSSISYEKFIASGKQRSIKEKIVQCIIAEPNQTAGEIGSVISALSHSVTPRFAELEREGVIHKSGQKICEVTSEVCCTWALGGVKKPQKPTAYQRGFADGIAAALDALREAK